MSVPSAPTEVDLRTRFRDAMASVCTPVSVVTTLVGEIPHGTTVSAFASLSMTPPMVTVALDRDSELLALVRRSGVFGVNILERSQSDLALTFARKGGAAKYQGIPWTVRDGVPRLDGVGGFLRCEAEQFVEGGDHVIVLGLARTAESRPCAPLTYHNRAFGTHVLPAEDS